MATPSPKPARPLPITPASAVPPQSTQLPSSAPQAMPERETPEYLESEEGLGYAPGTPGFEVLWEEELAAEEAQRQQMIAAAESEAEAEQQAAASNPLQEQADQATEAVIIFLATLKDGIDFVAGGFDLGLVGSALGVMFIVFIGFLRSLQRGRKTNKGSTAALYLVMFLECIPLVNLLPIYSVSTTIIFRGEKIWSKIKAVTKK